MPTSCSRPSVEMLAFMYVCMYLLLCRLCSRPSTEMLPLFITVPTTCSRPIIEMVGFMYLFIYFSVFTLLATPLDIFCSNFVCSFVRTV